MKRKPPPHEITLAAFERQTCGRLCVVDIVETSNHFASYYARLWYRDPQVSHLASAAPTRGNGPFNFGEPREIRR